MASIGSVHRCNFPHIAIAPLIKMSEPKWVKRSVLSVSDWGRFIAPFEEIKRRVKKPCETGGDYLHVKFLTEDSESGVDWTDAYTDETGDGSAMHLKNSRTCRPLAERSSGRLSSRRQDVTNEQQPGTSISRGSVLVGILCRTYY